MGVYSAVSNGVDFALSLMASEGGQRASLFCGEFCTRRPSHNFLGRNVPAKPVMFRHIAATDFVSHGVQPLGVGSKPFREVFGTSTVLGVFDC